jgi:hypothetical protein
MSDLGKLQYFLGMEINQNRNARTIKLHQQKFIQSILQKFGMESCKPVRTQQEPGLQLTKDMCVKTKDDMEYMKKVPYRSAVGSLMYVMVATRPDIASAVGAVSQYCENPGPTHWKAVKRIFRYLQGTQNYMLCYDGNKSCILEGYSDANWGGDIDTRRSTTGYCFIKNGGCISWRSKRQPTVAISTTESEYMALSEATQEAIWLRTLLAELLRFKQQSVIIHEDNQGCIAISKNPEHHKRTKHIAIKYHFLREKVEDKTIDVKYCRTEDMVADVLTKPISACQYEKLVKQLGLQN